MGCVRRPGRRSRSIIRSVFTTFRLEEENGGTRLTVTETGFEALPEEIRQERYDSTARGYKTVLAELKVYVERKTDE